LRTHIAGYNHFFIERREIVKREYPFWIKERFNPQIGTYFTGMGRMSKTAAKKWEDNCLYGSDIMHRYDNESDYNKELAKVTGGK
jgi:hypothetical protein